MTLMEFVGCSFIAFGMPFAMFIFTIARDPLRIIVLIARLIQKSYVCYVGMEECENTNTPTIRKFGFFWLLSILLSSLLWFVVTPLRDQLAFGLVFSVLFQELFCYLFYKLLRKADDGLQKVSQVTEAEHITPTDISNKHIMAYVSGLGFGIMSGAFSIVNVLADMSGPGTIGILGDSKYFFIASAFLTLCFIMHHTFWSVLFFNAMDRKRYWLAVYVGVTHMLASCLTLLNKQAHTGTSYLASILPSYAILLCSGVVAFLVAGGSLANLRAALRCSRGRYEVE